MSEARKCLVYGLFSTKDKVIRYVGQTRSDPRKRYHSHIADARKKSAAIAQAGLHKWIRDQWLAGHGVKFVVLKRDAIWNVDEIKIIEGFRKNGHWLVNVRAGGTWIRSDPVEVVRKIGASGTDPAKRFNANIPIPLCMWERASF